MERIPEPKTYFNFSGRGTIYSFTIELSPPSGYEEFRPLLIALIRLEEGLLITAQLTDFHYQEEKNEKGETVRKYPQLEIGREVEMVTRVLRRNGRGGIIDYGYKFRPAGEIPNFTPNPQ